jgi:hypothetical protein
MLRHASRAYACRSCRFVRRRMHGNTAPEHKPRRRGFWLAVISGIVAKFGASAVLIGLVIFAGQVWSAATDGAVWTERMHETQSGGWLVLQSINVLSAGLAGFVAAWLSPRGSSRAVITLVVLALASVFFAQLPRPASVAMYALWGLGAPLSLIGGAYLYRAYERDA